MLLNEKSIKILKEFSSDYNQRFYGRSLSKKLNMNQKTISNILLLLEKENILKFSQEGKNKYYYLNKFNPQIKEIIKIIEIEKKIDFLKKNSSIRDLFDALEERAKGILLIFGSYANYSNNKNSDLDICIIGNLSDVDDLEELYHIKINILKLEKNKFNEKEYIITEIIRNHIILKGVEDFIKLIW